MFRFTIRELLGLVAIEAVTAAAGKKGLAADSLEELIVVLGMMIIAGTGYLGLLVILRLATAAQTKH